MTTLEYDWSDGTHTTFSGYVIDESGIQKQFIAMCLILLK